MHAIKCAPGCHCAAYDDCGCDRAKPVTLEAPTSNQYRKTNHHEQQDIRIGFQEAKACEHHGLTDRGGIKIWLHLKCEENTSKELMLTLDLKCCNQVSSHFRLCSQDTSMLCV